MRPDKDKTARSSRAIGRGSRRALALIAMLVAPALLFGCKDKPVASAIPGVTPRALFDEAIRQFHAPSADASGAERERLLTEAATRYEQLLRRFPHETNLCAQALRALGSIHASRGSTNEAVKCYAAVAEKYASQDWEVLQAWKAAGDLLWESNQRRDAKTFYARIVERFGKNESPQIIRQVVSGSKARLAE